MCGIFGEFGNGYTAIDNSSFSTLAMKSIKHRGPDASGVYKSSHILLGHCRLSVIDLNERSRQPMVSGDTDNVIVFNGEIYNYLELKELIHTPPAGWRTESDTEILLEGWAEHGIDVLKNALGMYAFAVWNERSKRLWLVRDRLGKKPLYWAMTVDGNIRFASEISALLVDDRIKKETSFDRLAEFFQHGFISGDRTGFTNIYKVPPGCALEVWVNGGVVTTKVHRYWSLPVEATEKSYGDWLGHFESVLENAVKIRLRSDVPVGAFLSGGVDSSVICYLAGRALGSNGLKTFLADFEDEAHSEKKWAQEVAASLNLELNILNVSSRQLEMENIAHKVISIYGDLFGDPSAVPSIDLCAEMRKHVTVALSGDGGDELLGGYRRYNEALVSHSMYGDVSYINWIARLLRNVIPTWVRGTSRLANFDSDLARIYASKFKSYSTRAVPPILKTPVRWDDKILSSLNNHHERFPLFRLMACDVDNYLPDDNLAKIDRASMAFGLEVRSPFIDHRLFELVTRARPEWIADERGAKRPLRDLYSKNLPEVVFKRRKMGFAPPIDDWMHRLGSKTILELIRSSGLVNILDNGELKRQIQMYDIGMHGSVSRIWNLLVAAEWWNKWNPSIRNSN